MSTIAVVSASSPQPFSLNDRELEGILKRPFTIGDSPAGTMISSQRDQIEVMAGGNKLNVRDLSGKLEFSQSNIPKVLYYFKEKANLKVTSYGVNFIIGVPCMEPAQWILDNIIAPKISERISKKLLGGAAVLKIESGSKVWNIKLEPNEPKIINIDFNASEITEQLPNQNRLKEELQEQFDGLKQFLNNLGL